MNIGYSLAVLSGVLWTIVYIDSIRIGIKDKSYAMPLWALGLNIAWEFLYFTLGYKTAGLVGQVVINGVWFLLDIGLVYTFFRYGRRYFPRRLKTNWFYGWGILVLVVTFVVQYAFLLEFEGMMAAAYSAFLQNLLMSVLFIAMLVKRGSSEGQTMLIAVSKFVGSLAPTISIGILGSAPYSEPNTFVLMIGILMVIFDLVYIWMLAAIRQNEKREKNQKNWVGG